MLRPLSFISFSLFAQGVCVLPQETNYLVWGIYHPLERGRGEALAYGIAQALFSDSLLKEVAYIHSITYTIQRVGPWLLIQGSATPEGLYAFFTALRGAVDRFPQRLQKGISPALSEHPLSPYFRYVYEDTSEIEATPLTISRSFFSYWKEGRLRIILRGRVPSPLLRAARLLTEGEAMPIAYFPPELPSPLHQPPRQGNSVVYLRWSVPQPFTLSALIAVWSHIQALSRFLCEERQLACRAMWVPLPTGIEGWIETALPAATEQAIQDFLSRPYRPPAHIGATFFTWLHAPENLFLSSWWACVWGVAPLPKEIPKPSPRELRRIILRCSTTTFSISE